MSAVIAEFAIAIQGTNRDETIQVADNLCIEMLDKVGGFPWVMVDDDWTRTHAPGSVLADDHGFLYTGKRRYVFHGPVKEMPDMKPGHAVQKVQDA